MGQSRKNSRRGGTKWSGQVAPPGPCDWTWQSLAADQVTVAWSAALPAGAAGVRLRYGRMALVGWEYEFTLVSNPQDAGGAPGGTPWKAQISWYGVAARVSEWSETKVVTSL